MIYARSRLYNNLSAIYKIFRSIILISNFNNQNSIEYANKKLSNVHSI